jgi:hypothetical protein
MALLSFILYYMIPGSHIPLQSLLTALISWLGQRVARFLVIQQTDDVRQQQTISSLSHNPPEIDNVTCQRSSYNRSPNALIGIGLGCWS